MHGRVRGKWPQHSYQWVSCDLWKISLYLFHFVSFWLGWFRFNSRELCQASLRHHVQYTVYFTACLPWLHLYDLWQIHKWMTRVCTYDAHVIGDMSYSSYYLVYDVKRQSDGIFPTYFVNPLNSKNPTFLSPIPRNATYRSCCIRASEPSPSISNIVSSQATSPESSHTLKTPKPNSDEGSDFERIWGSNYFQLYTSQRHLERLDLGVRCCIRTQTCVCAHVPAYVPNSLETTFIRTQYHLWRDQYHFDPFTIFHLVVTQVPFLHGNNGKV